MDVNIIDKSSWEKTIEVEVPTTELENDFEEAYKKYKQRIQLEGFRKGKVPIDLIKKIFGKEIQSEVAEKKVSDILADIGEEHKYSPISPAKLDSFDYTSENGLKFTAMLEIVPDIQLDKYTGFKVERDVYKVDDEDINETLTSVQKQHAEMVTVDGPAQMGYFVVADFQRLDSSGVLIVGEKFENRYIRLDEKQGDEPDELSPQLVGLRAGDEKRVELKHTHHDTHEQHVDIYSIKIKEVKEEKLPALDDEFAKDVGDYETLAELKEKLKEDLIARAKRENEDVLHERIINEIVKANNFEIPEPMIKNYLDQVVQSMQRNSYQQQINENELREEYRGEAIRRLKWQLSKDKICEVEKIEVTDAEVDAKIEELASKNEKGAIQIRNYYRTGENKERLKEDLLDQKVFEFLKENVDIKEKKLSRKDIQKASKIIT
ncbi:trigger factor [candidate division KSB1 bacterium]|nr:trigger factor [candidate division KSB1 bacterium]